MFSNHLVSVLVPCYNHENYVQDTIRSIIEQTYSNIELLVIDDGSTDNSFNKILEIKELYRNRFKRFVALKQNNKGIISVINELIRLSGGDYLSIVASDDILEAEAISSEICVLNANPNIMLVTGKNDIIDSDGKVCYWDEYRNNVYEKSKAKWLSFSDYISDTLKINLKGKEFGCYDKLLVCNHVPNGYLIRKSVFDLIGYYTPQAPLEDWWLMLQISKYGELGFIDKTVLKYRWHGANQMKNIEHIMQMEHATRLYEYKLLANMSDDGKLTSFNKFRHEYIYKVLTQCDVIKKELSCKKAHVEQLIVSERELQSKVNCQEGHIELLLQSERDLKRLSEDLKKENDKSKKFNECVKDLRQSVLFKFCCLFNKKFKKLYNVLK